MVQASTAALLFPTKSSDFVFVAFEGSSLESGRRELKPIYLFTITTLGPVQFDLILGLDF